MAETTNSNQDDLEAEAANIRAERARLRAAESELEARTKKLIERMPSDLSIRDMARAVGLSHQRVAQLTPGRRRRGRPAGTRPDGDG